MCSVDVYQRVRLQLFFFILKAISSQRNSICFLLSFFCVVVVVVVASGHLLSRFYFRFIPFSFVCVCACVLLSLHRLGARSEFRQGYAAIKYIKINGYRVIRPTSHKRTNNSTKNHTRIHTILCRMTLRTFFEYAFAASACKRKRVCERERERACTA